MKKDGSTRYACQASLGNTRYFNDTATRNICYMAWYLRIDQTYTLYASVTALSPVLLCGTFVITPLVFLITSGLLIRDFIRFGQGRTGQFIAALVLFAAGVLILFASLGWGGNTYEHRASIRPGDHIYNLAAHNTWDDLGFGRYDFFECDSLGIACRLVFQTDWGFSTRGGVSLSLEEPGDRLTITVDDFFDQQEVFHYMPDT